MLYRLERKVFNRRRITRLVRVLTVHKLLHILDESANDAESLSCGSPSLLLREPVQPLRDSLDVLVPEKILHKFDCVAMSKATHPRRTDSLDRRCLSFSVSRASVEISSTIILATISTNAGVRSICVYMSRRLTKCSIDSSKSASASQLVNTPFAALFAWTLQGYPQTN